MGAQEKSSSGNNSMQRVKVYRLNDDGKWDDQGTGHVTVDYLERSEELGLYVIDEEDNETLLLHRICSDDIYRKQEDTIISWRDPEYSTELALSFQETSGCSYIWDNICNVQRNMHFNTLNSETYHNMNSELRELPPVELSTLPLILKIIVESGIADQFRVTDLLLHDHNFVQKLIDLFRVCEDLKNIDGLHMIFKIVRGIILLNSPQIFEKLFGDEFIIDIIGCLEYDPDVRHVRHRDFLREHVVFKEAISIKDPIVLSKIHQTYRVGYLKDVILSRMMDDGLTASLNSIVNSNNAIVVSLLKDDSAFIQELFVNLKSSSTSAESKKNLVRFLHEFCTLSKSLQMVQQLRMYRDLVNEGVFNIIADVLQSEDKKLVLMGTDILILFLNQDSNLLRSYVTRQEGSPLFGLLVKGMLTDFGDDMHCQFFEILRILMDSYASTSGPQKEAIFDLFYEKHLGQLIDAIKFSCTSNVDDTRVINSSAISEEETRSQPSAKPEILLNICDLLCFCVLHHAHRIKVNFLDTNAIDKVLLLTQRREKYLAVAAVRFIRTLISRNDEHVMDYIVKNNTFKPIIDAFVANGNRYNLLNSAVLELFEFIRKENIKILLKYLVDTFWDQLLMFDNLSCIRSLKLKYDQATDSAGLRNKTKISDPRKRVDERSLEKEEEDYFNEDSDEEDSASASMPKMKKVQSQQNLSNGGSMGSPSITRSGGLVDYDDDEDDEEYKPPPKRQPESSGEDDGVVDSILLKRKSAPKEDTHQKSLPRLPKKPKLNALSSTVSRDSSSTPCKKKTIDSDAPRIDSSKIPEESEKEASTISTVVVGASRIDSSTKSEESSHEEKEASAIAIGEDVGKDIDKQEAASSGNLSDDLHDSSNNRRQGDDCGIVSNTSSAKLAVNGS